ncbi:hypothetical protein BC827DRAFT_616924 [Russula dissimulans]|nr:hypothetical protein BC827DRAFT_616924 [Russula dissimulans]
MTSFLVVSWATMAISGVFAFRDLHEWIRKISPGASHGQQAEDTPPRSKDAFKKLHTLLCSLCDLQIVTGLGILISGWSQLSNIEYYHEQLVKFYWLLTLNSFWSSRVHYMGFDADGKLQTGWGSTVRRLILFFNSVLALAFQIYATARENRTWNNDDGPCYNYFDGTPEIPWEIGLGIFCLALFSLIIPASRSWNVKYLNLVEDFQTGLQIRFNDEWVAFRLAEKSISLRLSFPEMRRVVLTFCRTSFVGICLVIFFLVAQGLDVSSYGDGFYPLTWFIRVGFNVWNTLDIVWPWRLNAHLIDGGEQTKWGFGQVLPWIMKLSVLLSAVDTFCA